MSEPLSIRRLIDRITTGDIRIPAFQRDFVWEPDQIAFLLDSIYKGYPIGTVILWKTDARLSAEKNLGSFILPEPAKDYPVNYVLDGQQRLTSIFSTFQNDLQPQSDDWTDIYFDMISPDNVQESLFMALEDGEIDLNRHFPIKTIFEPVAYRKAMAVLPDELLDRIDTMSAKFREYMIPNEIFESSDRNKVAIVFERINRAGTELNVFELLSAWSWSEDFDLVERFGELQTKIEDHGYDDLVDDKDLQLRICAGIILGETTPDKIMDLKGDEIRNRFCEIENGLTGAIDYLTKQLGISHFKLLPFPGLLVPLSCFFATNKSEGLNYTAKQNDIIKTWFWRSLFSRRFSSDVNEKQAHDIIEMNKLKLDENYAFKLPKAELKFSFSNSNFAAGNANSKSLIAMLNTAQPHSFWSGAKVDVSKALKKGSKHEYHHIFPQAFLKRMGVEKRNINILANICFLTRADNNSIKDKEPSEYLKKCPDLQKKVYLELAFCPQNIESLSYEEFIVERSKILEEKAMKLMG
ncbi:DUF262 domain-containing protein [Erwinia sp. Leaf53]|uniref:GmrSD restriction endonuclease domain-containing protein n=1 Tax=Erwinia sp. Leaf53 TaxID=1736225 RepID=UPI0006F20580|nr:DUF262 domain-containing protein [Erwinia sp. Leaf53]KQN64706.1 hypothetical protein ASF13_02185 [Erwinia sp. Leaf53]